MTSLLGAFGVFLASSAVATSVTGLTGSTVLADSTVPIKIINPTAPIKPIPVELKPTEPSPTALTNVANKSLVFDFNASQSLESLDWTFKSRGGASAGLFTLADANKAVRVVSDVEKSMAMLTVNIDPEIIRQGSAVFKADLRVSSVQQGAHLLVEVKDLKQRIFIEDMRNSPIRGDSDWKTYDVVIPKLSQASTVTIGIMMFGAGELYLDNVSLSSFKLSEHGQSSAFGGRALARQFYELIANFYLKADQLNLTELEKKLARAGQAARSETELVAQLKSFVPAIGDRHMSHIDKQYSSNTKSQAYQSRNTVEMRSGMAYLHLGSPQSAKEFLQETIESTVKDIERLQQQGVKGWIIDLRSHQGGSSFAYLDMIYPLLPKDVLRV